VSFEWPVGHDRDSSCGSLEAWLNGDIGVNQRASANAARSNNIDIFERAVAVQGLFFFCVCGYVPGVLVVLCFSCVRGGRLLVWSIFQFVLCVSFEP